MSEFNRQKAIIMEKVQESINSVLPILVIVCLLCLFVTPLPTGHMLSFLVGSLLVVAGMGLFTVGADSSMTPIGGRIGSTLTKSKNLPLILIVSFLLGVAVTVSEPDLQVLASSVPHIDTLVLLVVVGVGVGLFLALAMFRILAGIKLRYLLLGLYGLVFLLCAFVDRSFLSVAFDSGGVTTGPMTVPFILAMGVGVSHIRSDSNAESDSFGLVSLCSVGPILSVLVLSLFYGQGEGAVAAAAVAHETTTALGYAYLFALPEYFRETAVALLPILCIFLLFQFVSFHMNGRSFWKILMGIGFTYLGLVLFLTGVNVGFASLGSVLGAALTQGPLRHFLIPLSMLLGWFIISAEPAVQVLRRQIEQVSSGAISGRSIQLGLSVAIALAMGISMLRVLTGLSLLYFLIPGYVLSLGLSFLVPDLYTAIAFDSGGVASGPMTAAFMLQFMIGASSALGGNVLSDAFGIVAMVAMMPLITIQLLGVRAAIAERRREAATEVYGEADIIELWEATP